MYVLSNASKNTTVVLCYHFSNNHFKKKHINYKYTFSVKKRFHIENYIHTLCYFQNLYNYRKSAVAVNRAKIILKENLMDIK